MPSPPSSRLLLDSAQSPTLSRGLSSRSSRSPHSSTRFGPTEIKQEILTNYDMRSWQAQSIVSLLEASGTPVFSVRLSDGDLARWQADTASWKPFSLTMVRNTTIGAVDFNEFDGGNQRYRIRGEADFVPLPPDQWVSRRLEDIVDAILYAGPQARRTTAPISPALCTNPAYIKMRLDRIALIGLPQGEVDRVKRLCQVK